MIAANRCFRHSGRYAINTVTVGLLTRYEDENPITDEGSRRRDVCLRRVDEERLVRSAHGAGLSIIRHSCTPSRCSVFVTVT